MSCKKSLPHMKPASQREAGYREALREYGLKIDPSLEIEGYLRVDDGVYGAKKLVSLADPPTAIFAVNDQMAIGAVYYLKKKGFNIPEDISIIGFDDVPMASLMDPPLTTMAQPTLEIGATAVKMILKIISGEKISERKRFLKTKLVVRGSCKERG